MVEPQDNPHALPEAPAPRVHVAAVNGTTLYTEVRGTGPPVLIIPGGAEDAEGWRPVAERIAGHTVVTYDRRGTLRSGRADWPGGGAAQHADDAAALLETLGLGRAIVLGGSSGGVIAVQLALRHSAAVRLVLAYEGAAS
jgi:pimeloyl-ACP methyl ester carboxylesterase